MHTESATTPPKLDGKLAYSIPQAVDATGVGRSYLYLAIRHGELATLKLGKRRLIMRDDLVGWLASKRAA